MNDEGIVNILRLREKAAQCRQYAQEARSRGIAAELESMAHDYDRDAARIELSGRTTQYI
jgi:hypothetical protein